MIQWDKNNHDYLGYVNNRLKFLLQQNHRGWTIKHRTGVSNGVTNIGEVLSEEPATLHAAQMFCEGYLLGATRMLMLPADSETRTEATR